MMIKKRFNIVSSEIVEDGKFIQDNNKKYSFPTTKDSASLVMYEKALNKLSDENEWLKVENGEMEDYLGRLEEENEQLKQQIESYKKVIEDCDNLFCEYDVDISNLQAVEELFKTLDSDGDVE